MREDVDVGWGMLGLDNVPYPPPSLKQYVDKAVQSLMDLREKELELTLHRLGYTGAPAPIDLTHLDIPFCSQLISSQSFQIDWANVEVSPEADGGERERRLLYEHIKNPTPPVIQPGLGWFRETPAHLALLIGPSCGTSVVSPMRPLKFGPEEEGYPAQDLAEPSQFTGQMVKSGATASTMTFRNAFPLASVCPTPPQAGPTASSPSTPPSRLTPHWLRVAFPSKGAQAPSKTASAPPALKTHDPKDLEVLLVGTQPPISAAPPVISALGTASSR